MILSLVFIGVLTHGAPHEPMARLAIPADVAPETDATALVAPEKLHPEFRARLDRFFARAAESGEKLWILSGYRALDRKRARRGRASWHAFGLALDFNLKEHRSMGAALKVMSGDAERWERLGQLIEAEGLVWGGRWRPEEVFHIQWHPGMRKGLNGAELNALLALAGPDGRAYERTWPLFSGGHTAREQASQGPVFKGRKPKAVKAPKPVKVPKKRTRRPKKRG